MEINKVSIIGLGALGILYGNHLLEKMPRENLRIIADKKRIEKYKKNKIYCNGKECNFNYVSPGEDVGPSDLVIFSVKYNGLKEAMEAVRNQIGKNTIIISTLNGITSEKIIGQTYGLDKIIHCVAQGMDATKAGNELTYKNMGILCFGEFESPRTSEKVKTVAEFFDKVKMPYEIDNNMKKRLWGKFMLNVGVNQTTAVYETNFGGIQGEGQPRNTMIAAMREVIQLSEKERIYLTEKDLDYWLYVLTTVSPEGVPSMRQDALAERLSEVDLFAGTVIKLGKKYNVPTPVNQMLYDRIKEIESKF